MNGKIQDEIQQAIQNVMDRNCEDEKRWPDAYVHHEIAEHMAQAAAIVFDATIASSKFTEKECK